MPPQSNARDLHLHRFEVPCPIHGRHSYYLAGLDHSADDAALYLLRTLKRNGFRPEYDATVMPLEDMRHMLFDKDLEYADLDE